MRTWEIWWRNLVFASQQNPPRFVEMVMTLLAIALLIIWLINDDWLYLVLAWSYLVGTTTSMCVQVAIAPSPRSRLIQAIAMMLLAMLLFAFTLYVYTYSEFPAAI